MAYFDFSHAPAAAAPKPEHPGWDPQSGAYGYMQPVTRTPDFGRNGAPLFLTSQAPQRLDEYRRFAEPAISQQFRGALLEQMATITGQRRTNQRQTADQFAQQGVNPAAYLGRVTPEQNQAFAEQAGGMRGAAMAGEAGAQMDMRGQLLSALNQIESYYDSLQMQYKLASDARKLQRGAAQGAMTSSLIGAGLGAAGMALGGPGGYFAAQAMKPGSPGGGFVQGYQGSLAYGGGF